MKKDVDSIQNLSDFPFPSFKQFQEASRLKEVKINIRMDKARIWLLSEQHSYNSKRWFLHLISNIPLIFAIFYFVLAFILKDYWLIPYSIFPLLMFFTYNPQARKYFKTYWIIFGLLNIFWFIKGFGFFPPLIYWVPLAITYCIMYQLYEGAADTVEEIVKKDENALCYFWKAEAIILTDKNNNEINSENKSYIICSLCHKMLMINKVNKESAKIKCPHCKQIFNFKISK